MFPIPANTNSADAILARYTEAEFLQFVPRHPPRNVFFSPFVVPGDREWSWDPSAPNQLTSLPSGTVFPNARYQIKTQAVAVLSGKIVNVPYFTAANGERSLVFSAIARRQAIQLREFLSTLASAYVRSGNSPATRNDAYARRIALALDDWARYVPDYFMTEGRNNNRFVEPDRAPQLKWSVQRASPGLGLAYEWFPDELLAFDAIFNSRALADLSKERGYDVRRHITDGLFFDIGDFFTKRVPVETAVESNLSNPYIVLAMVARVLNRPDYVVWLNEYLEAMLLRNINRDGVLGEGVGYSINYVHTNLCVASFVNDYFLSWPASTPELAAISNRVRLQVSILESGRDQWDAARLPNGLPPEFGDTGFIAGIPRDTGNSVLLPAYGHVAMGAGSGENAVQVNQSFSDHGNHMRADVGAFVLWAKGNELLGNNRYFRGTGRQFNSMTFAHNMVTIDRSTMDRMTGKADRSDLTIRSGNLTLYEPGTNGLAVTEIDGQRAYANKASRYQRVMILNSADPERPYVVDIFRVTGGATHDYTLHGAIGWNQFGECSFPLATNHAPYPLLEGEAWSEPGPYPQPFPYYGYVRNVNSGRAPGDFYVTFRDAESGRHRDLRLWMTGDGGAMVHLGRTPNPRRDESTPLAISQPHWRPSLIVRRRAAAPLDSLFAGVIEPLNRGDSAIQSVTRLPLAGPSLEAVALRIVFGDGRMDTCVVNLRNPRVAGAAQGSPTVKTADGQFQLTGRIGIFMERSAASRCWTVAADDFQYGEQRLTPGNSLHAGNIIGETRKAEGAVDDAFITDAALPEGTALKGRQLSLVFGTHQTTGRAWKGVSEMFQIDHVERTNGLSYICLTRDHQLEITDGTKTVERMAPQRTFAGTNQFEITLSASGAPGTNAP